MTLNNKKGLGIIRVSSQSQLKGHSVETQKRIIQEICKKENIELIGFKKYLAVSGRKEESIEEYMKDIKRLIKENDINCLVLWKTSRLGRILPEMYNNIKDLIDNYIETIYTQTLIIDKDSFKFFEKRCMLYMSFMIDEAEGYSINERMFEGKKTSAIQKGKNEIYKI
jgi:DNA invertase Pin-like site-specific DNA recombinase